MRLSLRTRSLRLSAKLFALVCGLIAFFSLAVGVYAALSSSARKIVAESALLDGAMFATTDLRAEANGLFVSPLGPQLERYDAALDDYSSAFDRLDGIRYLPRLSAETAQAVDTVRSLRDLTEDSIGKLGLALEELSALDRGARVAIEADSIFDIYAKAGAADSSVAYQVNRFNTAIVAANLALVATSETIKEQSSIIKALSGAASARSYSIGAALALAIIAAAFIVSIKGARSLSSSFAAIVANAERLGRGDFRTPFGIRRGDEIGTLAADLDRMLESLNGSISAIKLASRRNIELKDGLAAAVASATLSSEEIGAGSESIKARVKSMASMIEGSSSKATGISESIAGFNGRIVEQDRHIEGSAAAFAQMVDSICNIQAAVDRGRASADGLVLEADRSRSFFESTFDRVEEIAKCSEAIQEMSGSIAGIAGQTSILAMNAAIEAAHAGSYGKGFAVVADEIGKLAQASAASSEDISRSVAEIVQRIREAGETRQGTIEAFNAVSERIGEEAQSMREIYANVAEMQSGSGHVIRSFASIREGSAGLTKESERIDGLAREVSQAMGGIALQSREVEANIAEIIRELGGVDLSIRAVEEESRSIEAIASDLDGAINAFSTRELAVGEVID